MTRIEEKSFVLLQPKGHLDANGGVSLKQQFASLETGKHSLWIVDLTHVEFIDSAGLMALVAGLQTAAENNCRLVLSRICPAVKLIFEITQLDQAFEIIDCHIHLIDEPLQAV
jgi:anti-sigma B factor antagonist